MRSSGLSICIRSRSCLGKCVRECNLVGVRELENFLKMEINRFLRATCTLNSNVYATIINSTQVCCMPARVDTSKSAVTVLRHEPLTKVSASADISDECFLPHSPFICPQMSICLIYHNIVSWCISRKLSSVGASSLDTFSFFFFFSFFCNVVKTGNKSDMFLLVLFFFLHKANAIRMANI